MENSARPALPLVTHVVAARPNIMKLGPLWHELRSSGRVAQRIVHTGQHWDGPLSSELFEDFGLPIPDANLGVGSLPPVGQFAAVIDRLSMDLSANRPALTLTYGDVRSTPAAAICSHLLGIRTAHYEAGFRTGTRVWTEEFNRIAADAYSDLLIAVDDDAVASLLAEGRRTSDIVQSGDLMCDAVTMFASIARERIKGLAQGEPYGVMTFHHAHTVDQRSSLVEVIALVRAAAAEVKVVVPLHPRTARRLDEFGLNIQDGLEGRLILVPPQRYSKFVGMVADASFVASDSGGLIAECVRLGVPLLSLNPVDLHPLATRSGGVRVCHRNVALFTEGVRHAMSGQWKSTVPWQYDGNAASRAAPAILMAAGA